MKKKAMLWFVLLCCTISPLVAQTVRFYSDLENGYSGYARVAYEGTTKDIDPEILYSNSVKRLREYGSFIQKGQIKKLSKEDNFLIRSALEEFELLDNEVYSVIINRSSEFITYIAFIIEITNNGKSFYWYGGSVWQWTL